MELTTLQIQFIRLLKINPLTKDNPRIRHEIHKNKIMSNPLAIYDGMDPEEYKERLEALKNLQW